MDYFLLDLAALTVGTDSLIVGAVLLSVSLNVDRSYVDGSSFVVFIIDTTSSLSSFGAALQVYVPSCPSTVVITNPIMGNIALRKDRIVSQVPPRIETLRSCG
jgi:hypothetical protein